jgi:UDP-GlcNAc:undecaprenyl-phosphate/decaprenyl-phosphate GlcNAc-1-phosphate transferase
MVYLIFFLVALALSLNLTKLSGWLAIKFKIVDDPSHQPERRIHQKPIALLGGLALYLSFFITLLIIWLLNQWPVGEISFKNIMGVFLGATILIIGGILDEKNDFKPVFQLIFSLVAILVVIIFGVGIKHINNPFGQGLIFLDSYKIEILRFHGLPYYFSWPADLITFIWIFLVIYAIKLLAGLDGLVPGVTVIGSLIIFCFCLFTAFVQPQVALLAIIIAGVTLGFLFFNFHPAKIFLGTSGEMFLGLMLGVLAVISGSKIATFLLILGLPILDLVWVVIRRLFKEKHSPFQADRKHLHFRLLDSGFSHRGAVIFLWCISLIFGLVGLFFPTTKIKMLAFLILGLGMVVLAMLLTRKKDLTNKSEDVKLS